MLMMTTATQLSHLFHINERKKMMPEYDNNNEKYVSLYLDILRSFPQWLEAPTNEITIQDIRPVWIGIDKAFEDKLGLYSSFLMRFQESLGERYNDSTIAGFEKILLDIGGKESLELFFQELNLFIERTQVNRVISFICKDKEREAFKEKYMLIPYKADFYLSLMSLGVMPGLTIGQESFYKMLLWLFGYNYALRKISGIKNSFDTDFQKYMDQFDDKNISWKEFFSENRSDRAAFTLFFYSFSRFLQDEDLKYDLFVREHMKTPLWASFPFKKEG